MWDSGNSASTVPKKEDKVAAKQEGVLQQPPGESQTERASKSASNTQPVTSSQAQSQAKSQVQKQPGSASSGQTSSPGSNFSQLMEQQIAQAIQPVLDEFRQQVTEAMKQPTAAGPVGDAGGQGTRQATPQLQGTQPPLQQPASGQQPTAQSPVLRGAEQLPGQITQQLPLPGALAPAVQLTEQQREQWLQAWLATGLTVLLTESTRAAIQQRAEHALHTLLQKLFEAVPGGNQEIVGKTEATLLTILREALDAIFSQAIRDTLLHEGQQTIRESLHGDLGAALKMVEDILRAMAEALVAVLRRESQHVLRLVLALALLALASSLEQSGKEKVSETHGA